MKYREFTVTPGVVGFKVKIGCAEEYAEAYFGDIDTLEQYISLYLHDPNYIEKEYFTEDDPLK